MKTSNQVSFQHSYHSMLVWFICTYILFGPVLQVVRSFSFETLMISNLDSVTLIDILSKLNSLLSFFLFMYFFYLAFYLFFPTKKVHLVLSFVIATLLPIGIRFFIDQKLFLWLFGVTNYLPNTSFGFYFSDNTYFAVYYIPSGILYYFYKRNQALQEARLKAEQEKALAELTHLRSQINPHFLFNSLNNIYALAFEKSDKILGAIEGLSQLLRYALYEKSDFVAFEKEWFHIEQMIKIEKLRLLSPVDFKIHINEEVKDVMIPPVILLPIVENIFKHGEVQNINHPPLISAFIKNEKLEIEFINRISPMEQKDDQRGIGSANILKRIHHTYGDEASFVVIEKDDTFIAKLSIPVL